MFAQIEYPERKLLPGKLDEYLANGWFRMRQSIFTTNFLHFNNQFYSAIWLRVVLGVAIHDKRFKALCKLNKKFSTVIQKSVIGSVGEAHEQLYRHYRQAVSFESSPSLHELLNGSQPYNSFNTHEINVYDGDRIIAAGFFDLGNDSAAGITCIYHPDYKKHSLGKYLMYLKMDFCKQNGMRYFYPGYVVPGYPSFDYKLDIGTAALQYLQLSTNQWLPYMQSEAAPNPLMQMIERLAELQADLKKFSIPAAIFFYKFFEANLDPFYRGIELFDFPVFLFCIPYSDTSFYKLVVYDVRDGKYHVLLCSSVINVGFYQEVRTVFDCDLLKVERIFFSSSDAGEVARHLRALLKAH